MAKKKVNKSTDEIKSKVDLSNLFDAAKSSFDHFSTEEGLGARVAEVFDSEDVIKIQHSLEIFESKDTEAEVTKAEVTKAEENNAEEIKAEELDTEPLNADHLKTDGFSDLEWSDTERANSESENSELNSSDVSVSELSVSELNVSDSSDLDSNFSESSELGSSLSEQTSAEFFEEEFGAEEFGAEEFAAEEGGDFDALATTDLSTELEGTELEGFESASIEELEFVEDSQLESIIESVLFATDRPVSLASLKQIFKGTNVNNARLKRAIEAIQIEYASARRGVSLEEVGSGYQLRTKIDNVEFMRRSFKAKAFKLSGPALEVLAIVAYKQPVVKAEVDEIRGVESGHLLRALMEKNLVLFAGKSDLPGKPMQYATSRKFLEIFGLRNLKELPTLSQIDELIPEGIGDEEEKPKLADITDDLSEQVGQSYSEGEEELTKITDQLQKIDTSSEFFEKEKQRQKDERDAEKAQNIREAVAVGEAVSNRDLNWLRKYEEQLAMAEAQAQAVIDGQASSESNPALGAESDGADLATETPVATISFDESDELEQALKAWDSEGENDSENDSDELFERMAANDIADIDEEVT